MIGINIDALRQLERDGQTPEMRTMLIVHEVGEIANRLVRKHRTPQDAKLYMADMPLEIGHALVQLQMLALDLGYDPKQCLDLGIRSTYERFQDFWG